MMMDPDICLTTDRASALGVAAALLVHTFAEIVARAVDGDITDQESEFVATLEALGLTEVEPYGEGLRLRISDALGDAVRQVAEHVADHIGVALLPAQRHALAETVRDSRLH